MTSDIENLPDELILAEIWSAPAAPADVGQTELPSAILPPRPWGPWATVGWTLLCLVALVVAQIVAFIIFIGIRFALNPNASVNLEDAAKDGNVLAAATLGSIGPLLGLIVFSSGSVDVGSETISP